MLYSRTPVSISQSAGKTVMYTPKGVFVVDDCVMSKLLATISAEIVVTYDFLIKKWVAYGGDMDKQEEVINYLTNETQVLIKLSDRYLMRDIHFITDEKSVLLLFENDCSILSFYTINEYFETNSLNDNAILIFFLPVWPKREQIERLMNGTKSNQLCLFVFIIGEYAVISHIWSKSLCNPCMLCVYDYLMDRVYYDSENKINSLSNAMLYLEHLYHSTLPEVKPDLLDLAFICRVVMQDVDILSGKGRSVFAECNTEHTKIINMYTLEKQEMDIPFSFRCDCLLHYHKSKEQTNV
ncbi:hypothetical protein HC231_14275 [Brenneria izadpanahii]|uniref:McbB family protein n=1 Tax=Brenneria izadpanahii TaxID=2722756 RepID=A0ABX7UZG2_9GAMM|nr:hypothetical protein [Brenneria izadpanahii]QTF08944.1 hypothetical protein HC231_14275 [Brenneria izadpanahii]